MSLEVCVRTNYLQYCQSNDMDCISRNCNISGDERMVFCWLCLGNYHLKCNGLKARDADALSDKTKNIQWTYNFAVSPKTKRKRTTKASSTSPKDSNVAAPNQFAVTQPINSNPTNQFAVTLQMNEKQTNLDRKQSLSLNTLHPNDQISNNYLPVHPPLPPNSSNVAISTSVNNQSLNKFDTVATPKPLKTIPSKKTIFATRFALDTTANDIDFYIRNNLGLELYNDIQINKINALGNKAELQKRLIDEFKWRDIDIGTYEFVYKQETEISTNSTTSNMDLNTMFAAMMEKFAEVQEISKANNEKLLENNEKLLAEFKAEVQETSKVNFAEFKTKIQEMSKVINNRVDRIDRKVADLESNIDKKVADLQTNIDKKVSDLESKLNNLQCQEGAVRIIPETSSRIKAPSFDGTTPFNVFKFDTVATRNIWNNKEKAIELILALKGNALGLKRKCRNNYDDMEALQHCRRPIRHYKTLHWKSSACYSFLVITAVKPVISSETVDFGYESKGQVKNKALVKSCKSKIVAVRVLNLFSYENDIKSNSKLGECASAEAVVNCVEKPANKSIKQHELLANYVGKWVAPSDKNKAKQLLERHASIFSLKSQNQGRTAIVKHQIDTGDAGRNAWCTSTT
ncbi:hypothetical protein FF38_11116 [Lucilia cuprina]|uniref:Uncharacterized protein n=1 Tax=Lucilia cuprina TaxID=7375 RepID=A0A0L0CRQ1_LUCCU|nr:hypothetical protein FF38_11116 [Lucilia cuprina]